jgi:hypothetical protein
MALIEILCSKLVPRIAKILLSRYAGKPGDLFTSDFVDMVQEKFTTYQTRQQAKREFERLGERVTEELLPIFEKADEKHLKVEAVISELERTLSGQISAALLLANDLDTRQLTDEFRRFHKGTGFSEAETELYDRALQSAVRYLVEIAAKLPDFEVTQARESLKRLSRIEAVLDETAELVERVVLWVSKQGEGRLNQQYETDYRLAVSRNLDYVLLFGAGLAETSKSQCLSVAYISLTLTETRDRHAVSKPLPVEAVLRTLTPNAERLLIKGEAGSGKSTLFRWAAIEAAVGTEREQALRRIAEKSPTTRLDSIPEEASLTWRGKVPFLVRLRNCKGGQLPRPDELPELIAKEIGRPPAEWVVSVLRAGRALVLFDGIDELPNFDRESIKKEIGAIIGSYPNNYFIASTRPEAIRSNWLEDLGFREASLNPLNDSDRSRFVDRWHTAVGEELKKLNRPKKEIDDLVSLSTSLKRALTDNPAIGRLATNPLLCAVICALHRDMNRYIPDSLGALCDSLCDLLLERDPARGIQSFPEPYLRLTTTQRRSLVKELAYCMILNDETSLTIERAEKEIGNILQLFPGHSSNNADVVCECLVERCGMLREIEPGHLDFIHNTFKEFLAGERFADSGYAGLLSKHALDPTWQGVILFSVMTPRKEFASNLITRLLQIPIGKLSIRGIEDPARARFLLCLKCRAAAVFISEDLEQKLLELVEDLAPPRNMAEAEIFASVGKEAVHFLRFEQGHEATHSAACVRALRLIGTSYAQDALNTYIRDRRKSVILELAQSMHPLKIVYYLEDLLTGGEELFEVVQHVTDLLPLATLPIERKHVVRRLVLKGAPIYDLSPISEMKDLRSLLLPGTKVKDISPLAALTNIEELDLAGTLVTDLSTLAQLKNLSRLDISGTQVSTLEPLATLINLERLDLSYTNVRDLKPLSHLKKIKHLNFLHTSVSDFSAVSALPHLQIMDLRPNQ